VRNQADHNSIGRTRAGRRATALLLPVAVALMVVLAFGTVTSFAAPAPQPLAATAIPCGTTGGPPCPTPIPCGTTGGACPTLIPTFTKVPTFTTVPATSTTVPATFTSVPGTSTAVPATNTPTSGGGATATNTPTSGGAAATDTPTTGAAAGAAAAATETPTVVAVAGAAQVAPAVAAASLPASGGFALLPLLALGAGFAAAGLAFRRTRR
jgi:hypothetical protein